jgi:hypothetical protein
MEEIHEDQVMEWVVAFEFGGVQFYVDEPVHYWVYPHVEKGTGVVTGGSDKGVRSTGQTLIDVTAQGFGEDLETFILGW